MAQKKNQHYVPVLYLKLFSINNNETQIGMFNLSNNLFLQSVGLRHQAKGDYFYGEDSELEEELSKLEGLASPHIKQLLSTGDFPKYLSKGYIELLSFIIILSNRTKDVVEEIKETTSKLINEVMSHDEKMKHLAGKYEIYPSNPAAMAVSIALERLQLAYDLEIKLLINKTSQKFITSDNPVVKYNQFLEQRKHPGGHMGLAAKGLQLYFPISPSHAILLYDSWAYKIGDKRNSIVEIYSIDDIQQLNSLQILNCLDHIYFNHEVSEKYIRDLYSKVSSKRKTEYSTLKKTHSYKDKAGAEHIFYHDYGNNLQINLNVSFMKQTKKAKQHVLSDYVVQLRNEKIRNTLSDT